MIMVATRSQSWIITGCPNKTESIKGAMDGVQQEPGTFADNVQGIMHSLRSSHHNTWGKSKLNVS